MTHTAIKIPTFLLIFQNCRTLLRTRLPSHTMGRKPKYQCEAEKKAALAMNKKLKRSTMKERNKAQESNYQWISQYLCKVSNQVTQMVERRRADAKQKAKKRLVNKKPIKVMSAEECHDRQKEKNKNRMREIRSKVVSEKVVSILVIDLVNKM